MANILNNIDDYRYWRDTKRTNSLTQLSDCLVPINDPFGLTKSEKQLLVSLCRHNNFALFQTQEQSHYANAIISINRQLGLINYDQHLYADTQGLAHITQSNDNAQGEFIPYTNKAIGWHTDGYYNGIANRIRGFSLFCVTPAKQGGESQWIDPQMLYLLLREYNPEVAQALTHPQAMSIPEHKVDGNVRRITSTGPIFFVDEQTGALSMRYTQRKKNIVLFASHEITQAIKYLDELLNTPNDYHFQHLMQSGQGIICNNILHKRSAFTDDPAHPRLLLRGRYFNRIG